MPSPNCRDAGINGTMNTNSNRRSVPAGLACAAGTALLPRAAGAQTAQNVSPTPAERDYSSANPLRYPDPDVIALDDRFRRYMLFNTPILRLHTGTLWAEGPAWNGVGRYLVWSDIPNNAQQR
jgi:gluconolactonase